MRSMIKMTNLCLGGPPGGCAWGGMGTGFLHPGGTGPLKGVGPGVWKWDRGLPLVVRDVWIDSQPVLRMRRWMGPGSRVGRLPPSSHVGEPSVAARCEHCARDGWSMVDLLRWLNCASLPITFP